MWISRGFLAGLNQISFSIIFLQKKKNGAMKIFLQNIVPSMIDAFVVFAVGLFFGPVG